MEGHSRTNDKTRMKRNVSERNYPASAWRRVQTLGLTRMVALIAALWLLFGITSKSQAQFVHPGIGFTQGDLDRIRTNALGGLEPWNTDYKFFKSDPASQSTYSPSPVAVEIGSGGVNQGNFPMRNDADAAFRNAMMWYITGIDAYRTNAIHIINAWSYTLTNFDINDDITAYAVSLSFCNAGEILRYEGGNWAAADLGQFEGMLTNLLYPALTNKMAADLGGNQQSGCLAGIMAQGVFCDLGDYYNYAASDLQTNSCSSITGQILSSGQECEEGRDQAHTMDGLQNFSMLAQMEWCQGSDLYSTATNRLLAGYEYFADYNMGGSVPYQTFGPCNASYNQISAIDRGRKYDSFEQIYNHYVILKGLSAPYTTQMVNRQRPESGDGGSLLYYSGPPITITQLIPNGTTSLISRLNNLCADIQGGSTAWKALLVSGNYTGAASQQWQITHQGLNVYSIVNVNSGLITDIPGASMGDGVAIQQYGTNGGFQQYWKAVTNVDGTLTLYNFNSGYAMTISNGLLGAGAYLLQNFDSGSGMPFSQEWTVGVPSTSPPSAPTGLSAAGQAGAVALNWSLDAITTSYNVKRATTSGGPYTTLATGVTSTSYNDTAVVNGTIYYYVISAVNQNGESANSSEASAKAGLPSPWNNTDIGTVGLAGSSSYNATSNSFSVSGAGSDIGSSADSGQVAYLSMTNDGTISVRLASKGGGKTGLAIRQDLTSGSLMSAILLDGAQVRNVARYSAGGSATWINGPSVTLPEWLQLQRSGTSIIVSYSADGANWTALATNNQSSLSSVAYVGMIVCSRNTAALSTAVFDNVTAPGWSSGGTSAPTAPTGLAATGGNLNVNLAWTQSTSSGITGNNVYRSTTGSGGPYSLLANLAATTAYVDSTVSAGGSYYYTVTAVSAGGESAMSAYVGTTTIPPAPTGLAATAGNSQVALSWNAATGASSYNVKRATTSGGPYTTIASGVGTTSYTDSTAVNGTTYYYVVSAVNSSGESANSTQVSAAPNGPVAPNAPTGLTASAQKQAGKIKLTWVQSTSANITNNKVYRSTTSGGPYTLVTTLAATTAYTDTGLTSGRTYYYVVTAVNSSGLESAYSNQSSATSK